MAVGGVLGIAAKGTVNRLMKVSVRRGEYSNSSKVKGGRAQQRRV